MAEKSYIRQSVMVPVTVNGVLRVVQMEFSGDPKDMHDQAVESARRTEVAKRRLYYEGAQYDAENALVQETCGEGPSERVPEHLRLHAYSTQIKDAVDFLAARLGDGFSIEADAPAVQTVVDDMVQATDTIYALSDEGEPEIVTDLPLREAMVAGDTPVYVGWDPIEQRVVLEFWECERVQFDLASAQIPEKVTRTEVVWATDDAGVDREIVERKVYEMVAREDGVRECRVQTFWDDERDPRETGWLGVGSLPWRLLRADRTAMREFRGSSLVTSQAMGTADRYNAVEQTGYLISRYNSHSNVAVIGDGASLRLESDGRVQKDVADVLTFPGGTALQVLELPTDPQMINHQAQVLADALYQSFGITRVDQSTITGLGELSGYALEILNQKTDGTFQRLARQWRKDWAALIDLALDVYAWKAQGEAPALSSEGPEVPAEDQVADEPVEGWWAVDPDVVFPNRKLAIRMGTGYVVDDVKIRDDFVADLISREQALRERGYDDGDIRKIVREIDAAKKAAQPEPAETGRALNGFQAESPVGSTVAAGIQRVNGE